jgi:hypothetical protein
MQMITYIAPKVITAPKLMPPTKKYRRLVVEHTIFGKKNGKRYPAQIIDGDKWGEDFDHFIDGNLRMQYSHEGESPIDGQPVQYNQLFMLTTMEDEEILALYY